jgi:alkylation response protein AidB-like acyl-CoA dehydrogenase
MAVDEPVLDTTTILANAAALGPDIESRAAEIDRDRRLPDDLVEQLRAAGMFRVAFPRAWGGPEMDILSQCHLVEELAYHDASVGWVVMICSDSGHYASRIDQAVARSLYPSLDLATAGSLFPVGRAERTTDGYRVSGRWPFGSGSLHADHIVAGCLVFDDGELVLDDEGLPEMRAVWLPRPELVIHDTWYTTGLKGTGSNDYEVQDAWVPESHGFHPFRLGPRPETLYGYRGFFFANLSGVAIGTARRMIDDLRDAATRKVVVPAMTRLKEDARVQVALSEATATIGAARAFQDQQLGAVWEAIERGDELTLEQRAGVGLASIFAVQSALRVSEMVCEAIGSDAIYASSPFDRRRRDVATMSAHVIGARKTYQQTGQLLFGDEPRIGFF